MPWQICFELPQPTGIVCMDVPLAPIWRPKEPDPWISGNVLDVSTIRDLSILATMDELASSLNDATLKKTMHAAIQGGVKQPALKGVTINFKVKKG